ncbi:hypothetical protein BJV78DRAFT_1290302 [Lactifluus subvellereus]|nr:hypothetical protein BJV78DRAFT_1290302 [Lactifluus subvellereus]
MLEHMRVSTTPDADNCIFQDDVSLSDPTSTLSCGVCVVTSISSIFATLKWQICRLPMLTLSPYHNCKGVGSVAPSTSPSHMLPLYHMKIRSIGPGPSHQHQETFGKSGAWRIVPGQYLATNPKGHAVMIAAMEKLKLVNPSIVHHIVGIYVGFENPMFAALEVDYVEADQDPTGEAAANAGKLLTYYELDLGLNHVM